MYQLLIKSSKGFEQVRFFSSLLLLLQEAVLRIIDLKKLPWNHCRSYPLFSIGLVEKKNCATHLGKTLGRKGKLIVPVVMMS